MRHAQVKHITYLNWILSRSGFEDVKLIDHCCLSGNHDSNLPDSSYTLYYIIVFNLCVLLSFLRLILFDHGAVSPVEMNLLPEAS